MITSSPAHPFINGLKTTILFSTFLFVFSQSQALVTAPYHSALFDLLFSPLALVTLNFHYFSLQMFFDFLIINFFLTPLSSFVFSFLGKKRFILLLVSSALFSSLFLHLASFLTEKSFAPTTLFAHVSLAILSFWATLNMKHTSTHFLFIPLKPITLLSISFLAAAMPSFLENDWIKFSSLLFALLFGYITASGMLYSFRLKDRR